MGQRVKNTIDVCDLPYNRHTLWEKEYHMVRLARASECEVNGVDNFVKIELPCRREHDFSPPSVLGL